MPRWLRFIFGGGVNTVFTYGVYLALNLIMTYRWAYLIAYVLGVVFAYYFNAVFVFDARLSWKGLFAYPVVYIVQYGVSALLLEGLVKALDMSPKLAPLVVIVVMIPITYFLNKYVLKASEKTVAPSGKIIDK